MNPLVFVGLLLIIAIIFYIGFLFLGFLGKARNLIAQGIVAEDK